ncbi:MAG: WYL domain-containing protein [Micropruina glycogenica]
MLRDAATRRRRLALTYAAAGSENRGTPTVRVVDPYGLVENAGRWYLLAGRDGDQRTYRVSRIVSAEVLDEAAQIPAGSTSPQRGRRSATRSSSSARPARSRWRSTPRSSTCSAPTHVFNWRPARIVAEGEHEGWAVLTLTFRAWRAAVAIVLAYGEQAKLLAPTYLRARVLDLARSQWQHTSPTARSRLPHARPRPPCRRRSAPAR